MGGGDWIEGRKEQQVQQVKKAYAEVKPVKESTVAISRETREANNFQSFQEVDVDGIDMAYAWFRTFTPSWMMALIFIIGFLTLVPSLLNRFGFEINFRLNRKKGS